MSPCSTSVSDTELLLYRNSILKQDFFPSFIVIYIFVSFAWASDLQIYIRVLFFFKSNQPPFVISASVIFFYSSLYLPIGQIACTFCSLLSLFPIF